MSVEARLQNQRKLALGLNWRVRLPKHLHISSEELLQTIGLINLKNL